jgi:5-methylcytosine-specific restriction endonuclease McrA
MKSSISLPVLVLNKNWTPISIMPVKKAITKVMAELAQVLDVASDSYNLYDFQNWASLEVLPGERFIQGSRIKIKLPEIIVLSEYDKMPEREVKLTRKNLLIRDNYTCQYTGVKINMETATMDHILPRSKGGGTTWENLVMCCLEVNAKKANRTPSEAGLKLLKKPEKPKWNPIYARFARLVNPEIPQSWKKFIQVSENAFGLPA